MLEIHPLTRKEWRAWLRKNHLKESKVTLIKYKVHTGKPTISHKDAMEDAIRFGWIDTTVKRLDEDRYIIRFSKRTKNSRWSNNTLSYGKKLYDAGKMSRYGRQMYEEGRAKPVIDHGLPRNPKTPAELTKELRKLRLEGKFKNMAPSFRRYNIYWIEKGKRKETRAKRARIVAQLVQEK